MSTVIFLVTAMMSFGHWVVLVIYLRIIDLLDGHFDTSPLSWVADILVRPPAYYFSHSQGFLVHFHLHYSVLDVIDLFVNCRSYWTREIGRCGDFLVPLACLSAS